MLEDAQTFVFCVDVGAPRNLSFGWAGQRVGDSSEQLLSGSDIATCATEIAKLLNRGCSVSLGFESPLYVPFRVDPLTLTDGRQREGSPAWSASTGATVLTTGLVVTGWLLQRIREQLTSPQKVYIDWEQFKAAGRGLHVWEAKVSGKAKATPPSHSGDAVVAVDRFMALLPSPQHGTVDGTPVFSLIGATLLRAGWSTDLGLLSEPCIFIVA